jgi:hypothetical protein
VSGIDGRKPAVDFTKQERNNPAGGIRQKFMRRNHVWQSISFLIKTGGFHVNEAIFRIKEIYGHNLSVSGYIDAIKETKRRERQQADDGRRVRPRLL